MSLKSTIPNSKSGVDTKKKEKLDDDSGLSHILKGRKIDGSASSAGEEKRNGRFKGDLSHSGGKSGETIAWEPPEAAQYPYHTLSPRTEQHPKLDELVIQEAEAQAGPLKFDWISVVLQPLGALAVVIVLMLLMGSMSTTIFMLVSAVSGVLGILWGTLRFHKQKKEYAEGIAQNEQKYQDYLDKIEEILTEKTKLQLQILNETFPAGVECAKWNEADPNLWSVGAETDAFLNLRVGTGRVDNAQVIHAPQEHYKEENRLNDDARELATRYAILKDAPICCHLRRCGSLGITGEREKATALCRSLLVQAAALCSYEDLKLVLVYPDKEKEKWEAIRFLPHIMDNNRQERYLACNTADAQSLLKSVAEIIDKRRKEAETYSYSATGFCVPHYLVVVADLTVLSGTTLGHELCANREDLGLSTIFIAPSVKNLPKDCAEIAELESGKFYRRVAEDEAIRFQPDTLEEDQWERFLTRVSPIRLETPRMAREIPDSVGFFDCYGVSSAEEIDLAGAWQKNNPMESMKVLLGRGEEGKPEYFDIHPNAEGANGIFVGGTSSGKSTMVRSWVLSMAATFSPERVNFVLIDFKQVGLQTGLSELPHVTGTVGMLDRDIERNLTALEAEISRRQRLFDGAKVTRISDYLKKHYDHDPNAEEPMAYLYIVVDELNEFKLWSQGGAGDNWMKLLDRLFQTGSSLGIHVIAGSQTPGPFTAVMFGNARFRWCLRTNEPSDSKTILGSDAAYGITNKGRAFISVGGKIRELQPMYADGPYYTPEEKRKLPESEMALVDLQGGRRTVQIADGYRKSELNVLCEYIQNYCRKNRIVVPEKLWAPPLPDKLIYPDNGGKSLCAVVGIADDPATQSQFPLEIELQKFGSFLIYGAVQTGKTTFLRTFAFSLLENTDPKDLEMYIIESNPGEFGGFEAYPQVSEVTDQYNAADVIKAVSEELALRLKNGTGEDKKVLLLIDNLAPVLSDYMNELKTLLQQGPSQKMYVAASVTSGGGSISSVESLIKSGLCLWISESSYDYSGPLHSKKPDTIPQNTPGRGLVNRGRVIGFQTYRLLPEDKEDELPDYLRAHAKSRWATEIKNREEEKDRLDQGKVKLGTDIKQKNVVHDFNTSASLLVLWDKAEDRKKLLEAIGEKVIGQYTPEAVLTVNLTETVSGAQDLECGAALDTFLETMRDELTRRNQQSAKSDRPYIFIMDDFGSVIQNSESVSVNRIDKNLLLNGSKYNILTVLACSYADFEKHYAEEEESSVVPVRRAAAGRVLLLEAEVDKLPITLKNKGKIEQGKSYYLGESFIEISHYIEKR